MTSSTVIRATRTLGAVLASVVLVLTSAPAGVASTPLTYDTDGSARVRASGTRLTIAPTTFAATAYADGHVVGDLPIAPTAARFSVGGQPARATVSFEQVGRLRGSFYSTASGPALTGTASYVMRLSGFVLAGTPFDLGPDCRTLHPVAMTASTPVGATFDRAAGGTVHGTFTIPGFTECAGLKAPIERTVSGPGNQVTLHLTGA